MRNGEAYTRVFTLAIVGEVVEFRVQFVHKRFICALKQTCAYVTVDIKNKHLIEKTNIIYIMYIHA